MEPLWNRQGATSGKRSARQVRKNGLSSDETVATSWHRLLRRQHGKEGVSGSSPEEGSAKSPHVGAFSFRSTCSDSNVRWVWSPGWSLQVENGLLKPRLSLMNELVDLINDQCSRFRRARDRRRRQFAGARWPSQTAGIRVLHDPSQDLTQPFKHSPRRTPQTIATIAGNNPNVFIEHLL
jgi:hypothetical protein